MTPEDQEGPVWPAYADLMASLFAIALVLFVLTHWLLTVRYKMSAEKWERVQEVEDSVQRLADAKYFVYQKEFKRHVFREEVQFRVGDDVILPKYHPFLEEAGRRMVALVADLKSRSASEIKYLIIIEGMASRDGYVNNYELSYSRALALVRFWEGLGISFDPAVCEVIIAGSGMGGVGRYESALESRNQRFLIQILPKVGDWGTISQTDFQ